MGRIKAHFEIGIPGIGKSHHAKSLDVEIISLDQIRFDFFNYKKTGIDYIEDKEGTIRTIALDKIDECVAKGKSFVIDDANVERKVRDIYTSYITLYSTHSIHFHVHVPNLSKAMEQNKQRERTLDKKVLLKHIRNFDVPIPREYDVIEWIT